MDADACSLDALTLGVGLGVLPGPEGVWPAPRRLGVAQQAQLSRLVEAEIVPRLMLLHQAQPASQPVFVPGSEHVRRLSELAVQDDAAAARDYVRGLVEAGATLEQIFLDLLPASARHLGTLWEEDTYSFSEVTIGLWRLQLVLHELAPRDDPAPQTAGAVRRVLLAAQPGSQHTFGLNVAAEFFRRDGWWVDCEWQAGWSGLRDRLASDSFDLFGLSVSASEGIPDVASAILDIRKVAANSQLFVMVGGPLAALMPDLAQRCGADAMASDACSAVALANARLSAAVKGA